MFPFSVDRNQSVIAVPIQKGNFLCAVQNFKWQAAGVVSWDTSNDAQALGIDRCGQVVLQRGFTGRRKRKFESGKIFADVANGRRVKIGRASCRERV